MNRQEVLELMEDVETDLRKELNIVQRLATVDTISRTALGISVAGIVLLIGRFGRFNSIVNLQHAPDCQLN